MEPRYVNKITQTEQHLREMQFAAMGKIRMILYTTVAIFSLLTAVLLFSSMEIDSAIILLLCGIMLLILAFLRPILAAKKQYKRNIILTDGKQLTATELKFYDDKVITYNPTVNNEVTFDYEKFKKYKQTRHLHLLILPQSLYLMVDKNGFEIGNSEEFEAFIKEKIKK